MGNRSFSFYPAIRNIQHNEWQFRRAHPDEIQVMNTKSLQELWIPRGFLSGVSSIEEPVVIVGLLKELEYREGIVVPHVRRVIQMPLAANDIPRPWLNAPAEPGQLGRPNSCQRSNARSRVRPHRHRHLERHRIRGSPDHLARVCLERRHHFAFTLT